MRGSSGIGVSAIKALQKALTAPLPSRLKNYKVHGSRVRVDISMELDADREALVAVLTLRGYLNPSHSTWAPVTEKGA